MNKKVLVTGTIGFIFSNFIRKAIYEKQPYTFISIDKIVDKNKSNNVYANKNHQFYIGDVSDDHFIDLVFQIEQPDIVIHGAAETHVDTSINNPNRFIQANVLGTQVITNACVKYKTERLIYISTDEVYGQLSNESDPSWVETAPMNPRNYYSASKAAGEMIVRAANQTHGLQYNITRCSNNYGPRQDAEKFIPKIIKNILAGTPIPVYGQGLQIRDWTHVFDNCNALLTILNKAPANETYNISANQEYTNIEVVQEVCNAMKGGHELMTFVGDRLGHDFRYSVDATKVKALGWKPSYKFKDAVGEVAQWYRDNQWFLK